MLNKLGFLPVRFLLASVFLLNGCVANPYGGGIAFGLPPLSDSMQSKPEKEKNNNVLSPVYGAPQIIYKIDDDRYFTLEEYTNCENGKTFYNNKKKGIHTLMSSSSGYLFKGRLFWMSTRDDYLAFPLTADANKSACMGSDKGCMNAIAVTTDGGKNINSVTYGGNTQAPSADTKGYDILVTDKSVYLVYYRGKDRVYPVVDRWDFDKDNTMGVVKSDDEYSLLKPGKEKPIGGFFKIDMAKFYPKYGNGEMQCENHMAPARLEKDVSHEQ